MTVPWGRKGDLPRGVVERAYETCVRGSMTFCINSNYIRAHAVQQGRTVRAIHTFKGELHWSEKIGDRWCMFVAPMTAKYARKVDAFDHERAHFRVPVKCPMGPVRFVGFCKPRCDHPEVTRDRKSRLNARIKDGKLVSGARFRERQLPYVEGPAATA